MQRRWQVHRAITEEERNGFPELDPLLVQLLINRGLTTQEQIDEFLNPDYGQDLHDPWLFRDMETAVQRIMQALERQEVIRVYGDYDVDGVSASALLVSVFRALGHTTVDAYIPDRFSEGYGLNTEAIETLAREKVTLLIACDCGTSNVTEIALAKKLGMDVIVVDHHKQPPELPSALAFLNPAFDDEPYPWKKLCSTGVAYKLATALLQRLAYGKHRLAKPLPQGWEKWLLDLVALATVADMMVLLGENRTLVKHGLMVLQKSRRPGLKALAEVMGSPLARVSTGVIGFQIGPRLNAAGRLKHASAAFALLTTDDPVSALRIANELNDTNIQRQQLTEQFCKEAYVQVPADAPPLFITAFGETWPSGVIGLVAGRLKERYHRPALAVGVEQGRIVGSGRSISGFDITEALVASRRYLSRFGGHPMACGFTVSSRADLEPFFAAMRDHAQKKLAGSDLRPILVIDATIPLEAASWDLYSMVQQFEPFGVGAPEPAFLSTGCTVVDFRRVGREGQHLRLQVTGAAGTKKNCIGFSLADRIPPLTLGEHVDLVYRVNVNEWNGNRELQLHLIDCKPSS